MINFLRRIRKKLLSEHKVSKYMIYAFGEIMLVVVGILIALQINNWNENRKQNDAVKTSIQSLKNDLNQDVAQLNLDIKAIKSDLDLLRNFIIRLSSDHATIDTLKYIARHEYLPFFNPSNELNTNTITSLLSTGKIDYFNDDLKSKILIHNSEQIRLLKIMDQNVSIFMGSQYARGIVMQSESIDYRVKDAIISGPLLDKYWENKDEKEFLDTMLATLSGKIIMYVIIVDTKENLLNKTNQMLESLY